MIVSHRARVAAAFATIYLMWGGTFLAIRYAVADIPPLMTMVLRCAAGAALLFAWLVWRGTLARPSHDQWLTTGVAGVLLFLGCHGLLAWAEQRVTSGEAALFMTAIPLWLIALESLLARRLPSSRVILALALGIAGVGVLTWGEGWSGGLVDRGALLVGAFFWAVGTVIVRRGGTPLPAAQSTAMQLGAGAAALLVVSLAVGELPGWSPAEITPRALLSLAFLVVGGTVLGFGAYTWLLRVTSAAAASTYAFVNPVVALLLAWAAGDGELSARTGVAAVLVIGAVVFSREPARREKRLVEVLRRPARGGLATALFR
ncbi:MAG TPA: EamA family transporter [Gemmatimonadales bacterium]|nr:EamA family transporter [Gemmatimonadales bacterium]